MSATLDAKMDDWERFLESNYHQLSRGIRVETLLARLRAARVLTVDDQEMILHKYCTTFLKAGHLLDIVKMKGKPGFDKFMEAIEFEYPQLYTETTGLKPRPNPDNDLLRRRPGGTSIVVLDQMGELIHTFTSKLSEKQFQLKEFEKLVQELRTDLDRQTEEQKNLEDKIRHLEDTMQELRDDKKELTESLSRERRLREELEVKYKQLRSKNLNEMLNLSRQPIKQCYSLNPSMKAPASASSLCPPPVSSINNSRGTGMVKMLKNAYEQGNPTPCQPEVEIEKKTGSEIERPSADVTVLEENCCRLQESNDRLQCCIEEFKKDADECRSKQLDAESSSRVANAENEKLKTEMRKMEDQCKVMADMIRLLKSEIDLRPSKPKALVMPRMFPKSGSGDDENESQPSSSASSTNTSPDKAHLVRQ